MSDIFETLEDAPARKQRRWTTPVLVSFIVMILTATAYALIPEVIPDTDSVSDYDGPGSGAVSVEIPEGSSGKAMAAILVDNDVVATEKAFVDAFNNDPRSGSIQPGTYTLHEKMSAAGAVSALLDPAAKADQKVTIPEGWPKWRVYERLDSVLGLEPGASEQAAEEGDIGLPEEAGGDPEGWFAPLTYTFAPETTPEEALAQMVDTRVSQMQDLGIDRDKWEEYLIKGSILEREAGSFADYNMVAAVIDNRIDDTDEVNGLLQMDSTVLYGQGLDGGVPNREQLDEDTPYNTYIHKGLPPTPIGATGKEALAAVAEPADGDWLYFVTVNLDTGETKFSSDYKEHQKYVKEFREWMEENPQD
ncbi:MAG: endolytic transglycosylase MltG [Ancrocorticia sp.]|uniref:endolytic transglycosylase MltG n=1 Tax=Ancrocorticia sp. TaxID=2593684 RepID=UPI003F9180EE